MRVGIATDHGGFELKQRITERLRDAGYEVEDFGAHEMNPEDDYPDFVAPMGKAVAEGRMDRGVAICGSGVGACIAANKVAGVRAALINSVTPDRQELEEQRVNVICMGGRVLDEESAWRRVQEFLQARPAHSY